MPVRTLAGSRIHIALADMGFASPRAFGGVGFMIDRPAANISVEMASSPSLVGAEALDARCQDELSILLQNLCSTNGPSAGMIIHEHAPQHIGLGSKTSLKLAMIASYFALLGLDRGQAEIQRLSGRGGASGIGIHGFFQGGLLWDGGKAMEEVNQHLPSGAVRARSAPVLMMRQSFPTSWRVALCLPSGKKSAGAEEREFFESNAPIPKIEALETMALLYHGVLPAFRLESLELLASSLDSLAKTGFKRLEIDRCGEGAIQFLRELLEKGYAAGMSSMGPLLYVIIDGNDLNAPVELEHMCGLHGVEWLGCYAGLNCGARILREDG